MQFLVIKCTNEKGYNITFLFYINKFIVIKISLNTLTYTYIN